MTSPQTVSMEVGEGDRRRIAQSLSRWLAITSLITAAFGCSRQIEEEPPVPEHRWEPSETWCALMFDPVCPAQEVEAPTEEECVDSLAREDIFWAPVGDGVDACGPTFIEYIDCLTMLSCEEIKRHFALINVVPAEERSRCGGLLQVQLDCQSSHY